MHIMYQISRKQSLGFWYKSTIKVFGDIKWIYQEFHLQENLFFSVMCFSHRFQILPLPVISQIVFDCKNIVTEIDEDYT